MRLSGFRKGNFEFFERFWQYLRSHWLENVYFLNGMNSAHADGGPRSRVWAC
jgi:hypothetical protein